MEHKGSALISINKVYNDSDEKVVKIDIMDDKSRSSVRVYVDPEDLMEALMGLYEVECEATWKNPHLLGWKRVTKMENVNYGDLDEHLVDGWKHINGYGNHHNMSRKNGVTQYSCLFERHEKEVSELPTIK